MSTKANEADRPSRVDREETVRTGRCIGEESGGGGGERRLSHQEDEGRLRLASEEQVEEECKQKVLAVLTELSDFHSERLPAWREALRECASALHKSPPGGGDRQYRPATEPECEAGPCSDSFSDSFQSVSEDIEKIIQELSTIATRLDAGILQESAEDASSVDAALREAGDPEASAQTEDGSGHPSSRDPRGSEPERKQEVADEGDRSRPRPPPGTGHTADSARSRSDRSGVKETGEEREVEGQAGHNEDRASPASQTDLLEEPEKDAERVNVKGKEETKGEWITVGCLMVTGSEELVSRVIRVRVHGGANLHFPVTVVVPFCARYRGNYRDVAVKIVDGERRASYVTPTTTEGTYGGQRGSFAEVRVYSLGLFAVVSCLKRENYTVPRRGLSLKLPVDPRICLNYLPGAFTTPVMAQTTIQPVDTVLLAAVKSRRDVYRSVVSTSPLVHLAHPTSQPLRRPLTVTLPCPPNPEKKRDTRGRGRPTERRHSGPAAPAWDQPAGHGVRILGASLKPPKETSNELLVVLGSREKQWRVLEKVPVRSQQKGLASFELTESLDRLLVVRLLSPLQPCHLSLLAQELEESIGRHAVTLVLQCRRDDPHAVLVAALPSRDLSWELGKLRAQGYGGLPQTSPDISMREGDQLLLCFSGNVTSTSDRNNQNDVPRERLAFHSQRTNHLLVRLTEVDPFGNYSSPHYKGAAAFYKVTRADSLSDSLLLWLAGELSEEEVAALVRSLRVRRSAAQLVKLRAGDSPSTQAFHVLATWRRGLPAAPHQLRASRLARCLAKSGRPDLARELLLRQARTGLAEIGK
ncbi:hypothetical protein F2P81_018387 [Scophthalmus maximus]|uniref:Death domain-containing protein 1 n=1 Tax=Scophthalmus maximus TaxID=52904 RepID=A0A6A4SFX1_SCOMX|nr:hypothetical protein F2P81_018387 [Scophthalmus maximus]